MYLRSVYVFLSLIIVSILLVACADSGGADSGGAAGEDTSAPGSVSGRITYDSIVPKIFPNVGLDYDNITRKPIRGATVEMLDATGSVLGTTVTDGNGNYSLTLNRNESVRIRVRAELLKTTGASRYNVRAVDNTNSAALYTLAEANPSTISSNPTRNMNAASGWGGLAYTGTRASAPFAILDSIYEAITDFIAIDADIILPPLVVNWSENNTTADGFSEIGEIGISHYRPDEDMLFVLGAANNDTDEFDSHIIIHEWGHYFEDTLSRSDNIGGSHEDGDRLDMRVAFGEGFGNALSGMVTDDPLYVDTMGEAQNDGFIIDTDANNVTNPGWYREASVQSILFDLYDANNDGSDNIRLGLLPIYNVMVNQQRTTSALTSIFTFITALKEDNPAQAANIDRLVNAQLINSALINERGSNETNNAASANVLPVYTALPVNGSPVNICTITTFNSIVDSNNKLSNQRYLTFTITTQGIYTLSAVRTTSDYITDPDLTLLRNGAEVLSSLSLEDDFETISTSLGPGDYVMILSEFNIRRSSRGTACFDVRIFQ